MPRAEGEYRKYRQIRPPWPSIYPISPIKSCPLLRILHVSFSPTAHIDYIVTFLLRYQLSTSRDHIISSPSLRLHLLIHSVFRTRDTSFDCFTPMAMKRDKPFVSRESLVEGPKPEDWIKLGGIVTSTNPRFRKHDSRIYSTKTQRRNSPIMAALDRS